MDNHFPHIKSQPELDREYLRRINPRILERIMEQFQKYAEMLAVAAFWGVLIGSMGLVLIWAVSFGLSLVGLI